MRRSECVSEKLVEEVCEESDLVAAKASEKESEWVNEYLDECVKKKLFFLNRQESESDTGGVNERENNQMSVKWVE